MDEDCCENCFMPPELKKIVRRSGGAPVGPCHYCGSTSGKVISVGDLGKLFVPIIGEHYVAYDNLSQYRHADPGDGEPLSWLLDEDFSVFSDDVGEKEDLLAAILNYGLDFKELPAFEPNGSWFRIGEDWGHRSLKDLHFEALDQVIEAIEKYGHNVVILRARGRLPQVAHNAISEIVSELGHTTRTLHEGIELWRARVGRWSSVTEVKPPPAHLATPGRCNAGGQPVLYVTEGEETAIYEVRPAKSDEVTVARFRLRHKARVCDLVTVPITASPFTDLRRYRIEVRRRAIAEIVGRMLANPIRPDDEPKEYLITQVICRIIFEEGFDGIRYHSSQHDGGINLVFLEADIAEPEPTSLNTVAIKNVTYEIVRGRASGPP